MKPLAEQLSTYGAYHTHPWNRASHCVGVPLIVFGLLVALSWPGVPAGFAEFTAAQLLVAGVIVYYLALDAGLAGAVLAFTLPLLYAAGRVVAELPVAQGAIIAAATFAGGWVFQLVGHVIEGRRPAFADNLFQVLIAPIFLMAELFFALGLRGELRAAVRSQARARRDAAR